MVNFKRSYKIAHTSPPSGFLILIKGPNIIKNSIVIGESQNKGLAFRNGVDVGGRSR
jgi:hypothetical protein